MNKGIEESMKLMEDAVSPDELEPSAKDVVQQVSKKTDQSVQKITDKYKVEQSDVIDYVIKETTNHGIGSSIKSQISGPNGKVYEKNDIDYLKNIGYSKEQAMQELSKSEKYSKLPDMTQPNETKKKKTLEEAWEEINSYDWHMITKVAAETYINNKLEDMLAENIDKVARKFGAKVNWTEENKQELRNIIAGHYMARWNSQQIIDNAIKLTEDKLNDFIEEKIENVLNQKVADAIDITDNINNKIDNVFEKVSGVSGKVPNAEEIGSFLALKVDSYLNDNVLGKFTNDISESLGNIDKKMAEFGLDIGLQGMFDGVLEGVTTEITSSITESIGGEIAKSAQEIVKVQTEINKVQDFIKREQALVQEQIDTWKKKANDEIKKYETQIINSALGSLKGSLKLNI